MSLKRVALIFAVLVLLLVALPFLIPTDTYLKQIEQIASQKLGQPVTMESLHIAILPTPRANISNLHIGNNAEVTVESIAILPQLGSLFSDVKVISSVELNHLKVKSAALDFLSTMPKSEGPATVQVRRIVLHDVQLLQQGMTLPQMDVEAVLGDGNKLQSATLAGSDGKLKVDITPQGESYAMKLQAKQWTLPVGLPVEFDQLQSEMTLNGSQLNIASLDAKLYQGTLALNGEFDWGKRLHAVGKFKTQGIEVSELIKLVSKSKALSGKISGDGSFSVSARDASELAANATTDYQFKVSNGVLHGVDLAKAGSLLLNNGAKGGDTEFDELTGDLHTAGRQINLKTFKVASGLLTANGNLQISPARKLDGRLNVDIKQSAHVMTIPLNISGTLDDPVVLPNKSALAGAAIGTAIAGPLGTGIGVKAGSAISNLFGGKK
jgi:uncharacterized protein involved in outer membrane biogenesis